MIVSGIGRLTRDCEVKQIAEGKSLCKFSIAVKDEYKPKEKTHFFECVCFGKRGEVIAKYFHKGDLIYICGNLAQDAWTDKNNQKHSVVSIKVDNFDFCGSNKSDGAQVVSAPAQESFTGSFNDNDIPF